MCGKSVHCQSSPGATPLTWGDSEQPKRSSNPCLHVERVPEGDLSTRGNVDRTGDPVFNRWRRLALLLDLTWTETDEVRDARAHHPDSSGTPMRHTTWPPTLIQILTLAAHQAMMSCFDRSLRTPSAIRAL